MFMDIPIYTMASIILYGRMKIATSATDSYDLMVSVEISFKVSK